MLPEKLGDVADMVEAGGRQGRKRPREERGYTVATVSGMQIRRADRIERLTFWAQSQNTHMYVALQKVCKHLKPASLIYTAHHPQMSSQLRLTRWCQQG